MKMVLGKFEFDYNHTAKIDRQIWIWKWINSEIEECKKQTNENVSILNPLEEIIMKIEFCLFLKKCEVKEIEKIMKNEKITN